MPLDFRHRVRVYLEDTDVAGVVFYINYVKFFERARTEWLRSHGINQRQLMMEERGNFVVAETSMRFLRPARLDNELDITVAVGELKRASLVFSQQAWLADTDTLLAEGTARVSWVDTDTFRATRFPRSLFERIAAAGTSAGSD